MKEENDQKMGPIQNSAELEASDENELEFEETDETGYQAQLKKLRQKLKQTEAEKQEYLTGWQRSKADFVNLRKRDEEKQKEVVKYAKEDLVLQLIPVLDSFDLALDNEVATRDLPPDWVAGMRHIRTQLLGVLADNGVKLINPKNEPFDPNRDEALESIDTIRVEEDGLVAEVIQKGYELNGKLVRPAKVRVWKQS